MLEATPASSSTLAAGLGCSTEVLYGDAGDRFLQGKGCLKQGMQCSISCCRALAVKLNFTALPTGN